MGRDRRIGNFHSLASLTKKIYVKTDGVSPKLRHSQLYKTCKNYPDNPAQLNTIIHIYIVWNPHIHKAIKKSCVAKVNSTE